MPQGAPRMIQVRPLFFVSYGHSTENILTCIATMGLDSYNWFTNSENQYINKFSKVWDNDTICLL